MPPIQRTGPLVLNTDLATNGLPQNAMLVDETEEPITWPESPCSESGWKLPPLDLEEDLPPFEVRRRTWEDDSVQIFQASSDASQIQRGIRFELYDDPSLPRKILQRRSPDTISGFLNDLLPEEERQKTVDYSHEDKVDAIIHVCQPRTPVPSAWSWAPPDPNLVNPDVTARAINAESCRQFRRVPLREWIRYALGYVSPSVEFFFLQHNQMYELLSARLDDHPEEVHYYLQVEQVYRYGTPFAHRTILLCLENNGVSTINSPNNFGEWFGKFLLTPIRSIFLSQPGSFHSILKQLAIFSLRYHRMYKRKTPIDWCVAFPADSSYLHDFFTLPKPEVLARRLTRRASRDLRDFTPENLRHNRKLLEWSAYQWNLLFTCVEECCTLFPDMIPYFKKCARICYRFKNYHTTTALLIGLEKGGCNLTDLLIYDSPEAKRRPQEYSNNLLGLVDPSNNYAFYRETMNQNRGLPFVKPHVIEYLHRGEAQMADVFPFPSHVGGGRPSTDQHA
ncbi:hypothetical protein FQN57_002955 [Myotisia sp. PD_48]|nr:hypothetical protein FQN57_002955 [Myotisia sp. PD_48]